MKPLVLLNLMKYENLVVLFSFLYIFISFYFDFHVFLSNVREAITIVLSKYDFVVLIKIE